MIAVSGRGVARKKYFLFDFRFGVVLGVCRLFGGFLRVSLGRVCT